MSDKLTIQRASAGSGKTYTLAKKFIFNLIVYKDEKGDWQLRNEAQIEETLKHMLAITFTNKATNEMKQRIVANLSMMAKASDGTLKKDALKKIPYLEEFNKITGKTYQELGETAKNALLVILNLYSFFKISTIDSFFQEILRCFTYEANINDSYQLELDSDYVAEATLDAAFHELDTNPKSMGTAAFWLETIMKDEAQKSQLWNPFNKRNSSKSIYSKLREAIFKLEKENFKIISDSFFAYYNTPAVTQSLVDFYKELRKKGLKEREDLYNKIQKGADKVEAMIASGAFNVDKIKKNFLTQLKNVKLLTKDKLFDYKIDTYLLEESVYSKDNRNRGNAIDKEAIKMYKNLDKWNNPPKDSYYKNWEVFGELIPYMGLIIEIKRFLSDVLQSNNLIQISDTSYILKKIIGDDDAPFIYERLGNRLENYLIDEFQDTSQLQWQIIRPLLKEGLAKDKESLIIGDPKQSVYRFRNADHTLITDVVPDTFPLYTPAGDTKEENTNWRSHTNIVKFNNYFFKTLAKHITSISDKKGRKRNFNDLYSNVVQYPHNQGGKGYVEFNFIKKPDSSVSSSDSSDENSKDWYDEIVLSSIGPLISSLIKKGYKQKEIGVLVNTNIKGSQVVEALIKYNDTAENKIDFISEESLKISSSPAVKIIIGIIEKLANPNLIVQPWKGMDKSEEEKKKYTYHKWYELKISYDIFAKDHSDLPPAERMMRFLEQPSFFEYIPELISSLPVPSLGAIAEISIKLLIDESLRKSEAIYLTSLQDIIYDFSNGHHNDPISFIEWWKAKGSNSTISTPDGIDAVQIMTIHKSKGLEFKCVIIPFANNSFSPSYQKSEWRWVKPPEKIEDLEFPPVLPVSTTTELLGSDHEYLYENYYDQVLTDYLNLYYVAFTRARNELYVFLKEKMKNVYNFNEFAARILDGTIMPTEFSSEESINVININDIKISEDNLKFTYGAPFTSEEILEERTKNEKRESEKKTPELKFFSDYYINNKRPRLRINASTVKPSDSL